MKAVRIGNDVRNIEIKMTWLTEDFTDWDSLIDFRVVAIKRDQGRNCIEPEKMIKEPGLLRLYFAAHLLKLGVYDILITFKVDDTINPGTYENKALDLQRVFSVVEHTSQEVDSQDQFGIELGQLAEIMSRAEALRVIAESSRVTAEQTRSTQEATRQQNETTRGAAETARATAEGQRVTAESGRVTKEGQRVTAESSRVTVEGQRVTAESSRATAEGQRVASELLRKSAYETRNDEIILTEQTTAEILNALHLRLKALEKLIREMKITTAQVGVLDITGELRIEGSKQNNEGPTAPNFVPDRKFQKYIKNTEPKAIYESAGNSSVADWILIS